jgi:UDPglucose 6-dehydrogenase
VKLAVVGTGYVGLVSGACLAETGNEVTCVDIDQKKIELLKDGVIPIYEPGLEPLVKTNYAEKRLHFTTDMNAAVDSHEILMIAVGTPPNEDGSADLKHVLNVAAAIGKQMKTYKLIVTKSTVPVGTGDLVRKTVQTELDKRGLKLEFSVASNPEFLKEGAAVADFMKPDRIVIGCNDERGENILRDLYAPFLRNGHPLIAMDLHSSELCKYASNAMLATKISFMNELSRIAESVGADVIRVRQGMGADKRIGYEFTHAGLGYGGSCFPKDVKALISTAKQNGLQPALLEGVEEVNRTQRIRFMDKIKTHFGGKLAGKKIALWGLSFKPETDDIREAPALDLIEGFLSAGAEVTAYDPIAAKNTLEHFKNRPGFVTVDHMYDAVQGADALVLCTEWKPFRSPDFEKIKSLLKSPVIFDGRNQYEPQTMRDLGIKYVCIGRP